MNFSPTYCILFYFHAHCTDVRTMLTLVYICERVYEINEWYKAKKLNMVNTVNLTNLCWFNTIWLTRKEKTNFFLVRFQNGMNHVKHISAFCNKPWFPYMYLMDQAPKHPYLASSVSKMKWFSHNTNTQMHVCTDKKKIEDFLDGIKDICVANSHCLFFVH